jgi:hypothetical protein
MNPTERVNGQISNLNLIVWCTNSVDSHIRQIVWKKRGFHRVAFNAGHIAAKQVHSRKIMENNSPPSNSPPYGDTLPYIVCGEISLR